MKVVGVFSVDGGSESVGEDSKSGGRVGDVTMLRSYSSSASESSWYVDLYAMPVDMASTVERPFPFWWTVF